MVSEPTVGVDTSSMIFTKDSRSVWDAYNIPTKFFCNLIRKIIEYYISYTIVYVFSNLIFTFQSLKNNWELIGYKIPQDNGRQVIISPIHMRLHNDNKKSIQYNAKIRLKEFPKVKDGTVLFPKDEIKILNDSLQFYSQLISVSDICNVSVSSSLYSRGFIFENDDEKKYLEKTDGFEYDGFSISLVFSENFFEEIKNDQLLDRKEGVKFLSRANSQQDALSTFRELIRLFENAFAENSKSLANLLNTFLQKSTFFEYEEGEVYTWMTRMRHGATHADLKKTKELVFAEDVTFDIQRIIQAGYDVLFNKKIWHSSSTERRRLLKPVSALTKAGMTVYKSELEKQTGVTLESNSKPFYVVHDKIDTSAGIPKPPSDWWLKRKQKVD